MVAAQALRATVRIVGTTAVVRVYLVAQDLPGVKKRGRRPPSSFIFHLLNEIRASEQEWEGEMLEGDAVPLFRAESVRCHTPSSTLKQTDIDLSRTRGPFSIFTATSSRHLTTLMLTKVWRRRRV